MRYLAENWSLDPWIIMIALLVIWHEIGLARLGRRSGPERARQRRIRSIWFYAGLAVMLLSVASPISYWAGGYFFVQVIQHLLLMFAAPALVVAGAPWQPLLSGLPGRLGRGDTSQIVAKGRYRPVRAAGAFALRPWAAIGLLNAVMLIWQVPALFNLAAANSAVRVWLLHGSYFMAGVLFWLQFVPSAPFQIKLGRLGQVAGLLLSNTVTRILAMSMSVLTNVSWYSAYAHVPGVTFAPLADQKLGATIL